MDQAVFLFDNQYDPVIIDKVYHEIKEKTWYHSIQIQEDMMRQKVWDGPITDFQVRASFNKKMGLPTNAFSIELEERLLKKNQRYVMSFFMRGKNTISLHEILSDEHYAFQYTLMIGDYLYMEARLLLTDRHSYIVIIPDGNHGLTEDMWNQIRNSYGNELYSPNRWTLIQRPKVSYRYGNTTPLASISAEKLYLDTLTESKNYYSEDPNDEWKVAISDNAQNLGLLRVGLGTFKYDDTGRAYLELNELFANYFTSTMAQITVFAYNEDRKMGYALSPNYIGPTNYLKTMFDEYIAAVNSARFKVIAQDMEDGWESITGDDRHFGQNVENLVTVGFDQSGSCWVALPTADGICPVNPHNFRIWEYDSEYDMLGRMVAVEVEADFPNIYRYQLKSEAPILFIEWFRDDTTVGQDYDDITKGYRDYIGTQFYSNLLGGTAPAVITNFSPLNSLYDASDFIKNVLLYSTHEYRVNKLVEILKETGLYYDLIVNAIEAKNAQYVTITYDFSLLPGMYEKLMAMGDTCYLICNTLFNPDSYDLYIDGVRQDNTQANISEDGKQFIAFESGSLKPNSVIIIDAYYSDPQVSGSAYVDRDFPNSRIYDYPLKYLSGNDLVITRPGGARIDPMQIDYAINAKEYLIQVPETMVDWESLGITIDDSRLASRVGYDIYGKGFKSVVFRLLLPDHEPYAALKSIESEDKTFFTSDDRRIMVRHINLMVTTEGYNEGLVGTSKFSKKVWTTDIALHINGSEMGVDYEGIQTNAKEDLQNSEGDTLATNREPIIYDLDSYIGEVEIYNATVYRKSNIINLANSSTVTISQFYGADDPNRLLCFVNGILQDSNACEGTIPLNVGDDFTIQFTNFAQQGDRAQVVYLPFPVDRFSFISDDNAQANIWGTGIMVIGNQDLIFENGRRISNDKLTRVTNQIIKTPSANAIYTIIRPHRDSNLYQFDDVYDQSFLDKLFIQSPGYKQSQGVF